MTDEMIREFCEELIIRNGYCGLGLNAKYWSCTTCPAENACSAERSKGVYDWCTKWLEDHKEASYSIDDDLKGLKANILYLQKKIEDFEKKVEAMESEGTQKDSAILNPTVFVPTFDLPCKYKEKFGDKVWKDGIIVGYSERSTHPYKVKSDSTAKGHSEWWVETVMVNRKDYDENVKHIKDWVTRYNRKE
jgi:hypothetical protein